MNVQWTTYLSSALFYVFQLHAIHCCTLQYTVFTLQYTARFLWLINLRSTLEGHLRYDNVHKFTVHCCSFQQQKSFVFSVESIVFIVQNSSRSFGYLCCFEKCILWRIFCPMTSHDYVIPPVPPIQQTICLWQILILSTPCKFNWLDTFL